MSPFKIKREIFATFHKIIVRRNDDDVNRKIWNKDVSICNAFQRIFLSPEVK